MRLASVNGHCIIILSLSYAPCQCNGHCIIILSLSYAPCQLQWTLYYHIKFELCALPASIDTVLLYQVYLAERLKYVSIINHLWAVWSFHKLHNFSHVDPSSFQILMTLKGIRRTIGDSQERARCGGHSVEVYIPESRFV